MKRKIIALTMCILVAAPAISQMVLAHPWQGKRVAYFGDSITDPRNNGSKTKYWGFLQDWLGISPLVYGVSGKQWNDIPRQAKLLKEQHGDNFDAIMILMGTNDYNAGIPIGKWFEEKLEKVMAGIHEPKHMVDRKRLYPTMDKDTYRGRINIAMSTLKKMFPTKQIVVLTPIHRAGFYANEKNWQPTEDYQNKCGVYLQEYVNAIKEAANIWAVPVVDLNSLCGLYPLCDEHAQYFKDKDTDRLHPNDAGHRRMAATLMYQLSALPCVF